MTDRLSIRAAIAAFALSAVLTLFHGCGLPHHAASSWEDLTPVQRLEVIRSDTRYISFLDSCARVHIGAEARCLDAVQHLFGCGDRRWLFSDDWGGLLEIPRGWTPAEDLWQTVVTFHGTHVFSPDSTALMSMYSGFSSCGDGAEFLDSVMESMAGDSIAVYSFEVGNVAFPEEWNSPAVTVIGRNAHGINFYGRYIMKDAHGVEYSASLQWDDSTVVDIDMLKGFVGRFPFGPEGQAPCGDAVL